MFCEPHTIWGCVTYIVCELDAKFITSRISLMVFSALPSYWTDSNQSLIQICVIAYIPQSNSKMICMLFRTVLLSSLANQPDHAREISRMCSSVRDTSQHDQHQHHNPNTQRGAAASITQRQKYSHTHACPPHSYISNYTLERFPICMLHKNRSPPPQSLMRTHNVRPVVPHTIN